jgi:hypothetical protein
VDLHNTPVDTGAYEATTRQAFKFRSKFAFTTVHDRAENL